ncbi:hypothetical protein WMY93_032078 [Mugilogobius chulae]|uniref:Glypican-1 n=1 Tax=Mugilogobius chulae TaxID=88201 RepID=A0AAW0MEC5_9GOBI
MVKRWQDAIEKGEGYFICVSTCVLCGSASHEISSAAGQVLARCHWDGLINQINNPEVEVDTSRPDVRTRQLIMELRMASNKLKHALSGQDMDFVDSEGEEGSSGSGGGEHIERYNDDWPGYGPQSPSFNKPPHNSSPAKPRNRERNGSKWNKNGHGRAKSASCLPTLSSFLLLYLPFMANTALTWR